MKIGVIGSGISGLVSAWLLSGEHEVVLYEANDYIGGHTNTVDVEREGRHYAVDTGFIVFNEVTYPNFLKFIGRLGVGYQPAPMTFSVKDDCTGLEYSPHNLNTLFAVRRNLLRPGFYRFLADIVRFRKNLENMIQTVPDEELVRFLRRHGYSELFIHKFVVALGSSLWSVPPKEMDRFPLLTFAEFFKNHGFLELRNPIQWLVIRGGSREYVRKFAAAFQGTVRLQARVTGVRRFDDRVEIRTGGHDPESFDHVVLALHSDQALAILEDASAAERDILGALPYQENLTMLHTDSSILPKRKFIWSSWNYLIPRRQMDRCALTYDMNILQTIAASHEFCVTLNCPESIDASRVIARYLYHHPQHTTAAVAARKRYSEISGVKRTHYCGAYWGYGFHEDGVNAALAACKYFGKTL